MRKWTGSALIQVMACRLFDAKPSPEPILTYSAKFELEYQISIQENAIENVCETASILSRERKIK